MLVCAPEKTLAFLQGQDNLCEDIRVMMEAVRTIRRELKLNTGNAKSVRKEINVSASGTAMRFLTALCSVTPGKWILTGTARLCQRPVAPLVDALQSVGASISYLGKKGFPPLEIIGNDNLEGGEISIDGSESSQYVSALMLIADRFKTPLNIHVIGMPSSQPYIELTRSLLSVPFSTSLFEGDWSAAAFWYEFNSLLDESLGSSRVQEFKSSRVQEFKSSRVQDVQERVTFSNLNPNSVQGDKVVAEIFRMIDERKIYQMDFRNCPDLLLPVVVTCCAKNIPFVFTGVGNLRIKETDRLAALQTELAKFGFDIEISDNPDTELQFRGLNDFSLLNALKDKEIKVSTYSDHRMAMAFAPLALIFGELVIENPEVVNKSYPNFWDHFREMGVEVYEANSNERKGGTTSSVQRDDGCCGLHTFCEKTGKYNGPTAENYFEDEELDRFRGRESGSYEDGEIEEFREVLYTMRTDEVADWLASLIIREVELPDQLKDEAIMLIEA